MKQVMLAWADHQLSNGMIQESLSVGCLEETSKEGKKYIYIFINTVTSYSYSSLLFYKNGG